MREESHLDDMRAAIRGDFERLEERRGEQELMQVNTEEPVEIPELESQPEPQPEPVPEPEPEPEPEPPVAPEPEPLESVEEPEQELAPSEEPVSPVEEPAPERSWLDRLLGR